MSSTPIRVLLVEDNHEHAQFVREMLSYVDDGTFTVERAEQLETGLGRVAEGDIDVVLLDLCLPDSQGLDTFVRSHARAEGVPIVVLTGLDDRDLAVQAVQLGAQDYLVKEKVDPALLGRSIRYAIERKRVEQALRQQAVELQMRNQELDAFAHTVAHELQNLLALVIGYAEVLEIDCAIITGDELQKHLRTIAQVGRKMSNVVAELLLLAQVREMDVQMRPLLTGDVVSAALQRLSYLIREHEAEVAVPDAWPLAMGYAPWVEEVWVNYISNAIRYGGRPPRVGLGATTLPDGTVRFWVSDNGRGLTPEAQERLFTLSTQLDQVHAKGHGLGLSIVARIVEKLDGQVGVESRVGRGSVFSFTLPGALDRGVAKVGQVRRLGLKVAH